MIVAHTTGVALPDVSNAGTGHRNDSAEPKEGVVTLNVDDLQQFKADMVRVYGPATIQVPASYQQEVPDEVVRIHGPSNEVFTVRIEQVTTDVEGQFTAACSAAAQIFVVVRHRFRMVPPLLGRERKDDEEANGSLPIVDNLLSHAAVDLMSKVSRRAASAPR